MSTMVKRTGMIHVECPQCKSQVTLAPIFHILPNGVRHEAWAEFRFEKGKTGRELCKVIYDDKEYAPSTIGTIIAGHRVNGWKWWRYEGGKGEITLNELADSL